MVYEDAEKEMNEEKEKKLPREETQSGTVDKSVDLF